MRHPKQSKLITSEQVHPDSLALIRTKGGKWAVYEDHEVGACAPLRPHLQFLQYGAAHNTFPTFDELPAHWPGNSVRDHMYLLVGFVDLMNGTIVQEEVV